MWPARMALRYPTKFVGEVCRQCLPFRPLYGEFSKSHPKLDKICNRKRFFPFLRGCSSKRAGIRDKPPQFFFACTREVFQSPHRSPKSHFNFSRQRAPKQPQLRFWRPLAARLRHQIHNLATFQFRMKPNVCFYIFQIFYTAFTQCSVNKIESKCLWLQWFSKRYRNHNLAIAQSMTIRNIFFNFF